MLVSFIVACDEKDGIGLNNRLLCHLPADLTYFKQTTTGHSIVMGRKTYESIGRPLPGRTNIVLTSDKNLRIEGCVVVHSIEAAIDYARNNNEKELFITGGGAIFKQAFPLADKLYITRIHHSFEADTWFPPFDKNEWTLIRNENHASDEKNAYGYSFEVYERKNPVLNQL